MRLLIAFCFALAIIAPHATAQPQATVGQSAVTQLAREYVTVGGAEDLFLAGARYGFSEGARANGVTFTAAQQAEINAIVDRHFAQAAEIYISRLAAYYTDNSTDEDLRAALAFYRSPTGQRYVGASISWTLPLTTYLASNGRAPLAEVDEPLSAEGLELARRLAGRLIGQMHDSDRVAVDGAPIGVTGITEYIARSFASQLADGELQAAIDWTQTDVASRLEGPSAERTLAIQTATILAIRAVDHDALRRDVLAVLNGSSGGPT